MKTYVMTIRETFPKNHKRKGEPTDFIRKIKDGQKIHTLRTNYPLWKKRIREVQAGNAVLSVRTWTGKPRRSKQKEVFQFGKDDNIGIEKCTLYLSNADITNTGTVTNKLIRPERLAHNDGLSLDDFEDWFSHVDENALIHFTDFRYNKVMNDLDHIWLMFQKAGIRNMEVIEHEDMDIIKISEPVIDAYYVLRLFFDKQGKFFKKDIDSYDETNKIFPYST